MEKLFAVVDIETTGGHASAHGITEIAVVIYDGKKIIEQYETLVNPLQPIPIFIQSLTGINEEMTANAPLFEDVAERIFNLLDGKIFVAHNVNFDYSFVAYHLKKAGYPINSKKICSVRMARKVLPGYPSYSLGKLCKSLNIPLSNRHRAMGDAYATTLLLEKIIAQDKDNEINKALKINSKEQILPPYVNREQILALPNAPGVYYFKDKKDKIIYVGKAVNIYKRVCSHFSNNNPDKKKQTFLREIRAVNYELCGTELQALILETLEIKRLWPSQNKALKAPEAKFGLYVYETQAGYLQIGLGKKMKFMKPDLSFHRLQDGYAILKQMIEEFALCPKLSFLQNNHDKCGYIKDGKCLGACEHKEDFTTYNERVRLALLSIKKDFQSFMIIDEGRNADEKCCIVVDEGNFYGMGFLPENQIATDIHLIKNAVTPYPSYAFINQTIKSYLLEFPDKKVILN